MQITVAGIEKGMTSGLTLVSEDMIMRARFVRRPNRFVVICERRGRNFAAYMPNPGRLWELLFPGVVLLLVPSRGGRMDYTVMAIESVHGPILLHTHRNNDVARWLLENRLVPGLEDANIVRAEYPFGESRFDFLLDCRGHKMLVEVKSCTLFHGSLAMFPDAVTERGARHLRELARATHEGFDTVVLILAHSGEVTRFLPDYHTDLNFARAFLEVRDSVRILPLGLSWEEGLFLDPEVRELEIPWSLLKKEARDAGSYIVILEMEEDAVLSLEGQEDVHFRSGFYVYIGSASEDLRKRIESHRRHRRKYRWHIDVLRERSRFVAGLAVRTSQCLDRDLAEAVESIAESGFPCFGFEDLGRSGYLFRFDGDPLKNPTFIDLLLDFRMSRLETLMEE